MWSEPLPNGKVKYVERYEHPLTGQSKKVSVTMDKDTKSNRKLAQQAINEKINAKIGNISSTVKKENLRLSELVELYRIDQKSTVTQSTYTRNYHAANSLMNILGEDTLVDRLTAGYVREQFAKQNEKPGTTNERIARLKALIRWGYENDYIDDIRWIDKIKKFKDDEKVQKLEQKYLEGDELKELLKNMNIPKWRFLAELTALSGMRVGEAIALNSEDVDFKNRIIRVTKTYDAVNHVSGSPKTATSNREIQMQDELYQCCRQISLFMKREHLVLGYSSPLFISDVNGNYLNYYSYNAYLKETSERLFDKNVTSHFMRHTHVALMAEQGVPLDVISRRLGHSNSKITSDIYFHVTKKMKEKDRERVEKIKLL